MTTTPIANFLTAPVVSLKKRFGRRLASSALDAPPPPIDTTKEWEFGKYCWKATVESKDKESGKPDKIFIGYSQNMNIVERTKGACDRHKKSGEILACSTANIVPVRPNPTATSSAIKNTPYLSHNFRNETK